MTAQRACGVGDVGVGSALRVELDGVQVCVVQDSAGAIHALGDTCTHGEISLAEGFVEDGAIECWAHGSQFELATGKPRNLPAYEPVPVFPVTIDGDDVLVDVQNPLT